MQLTKNDSPSRIQDRNVAAAWKPALTIRQKRTSPAAPEKDLVADRMGALQVHGNQGDHPQSDNDYPPAKAAKKHARRSSTPSSRAANLISVRHCESTFHPFKVSSILLYERSGWFKKKMDKAPEGFSVAPPLSSSTVPASPRGTLITVPFSTREILELYIDLLTTDKIKLLPGLFVNERHSLKSIEDAVELYFLCFELKDPKSAELTLEEIKTGLMHIESTSVLEPLATYVWNKPTDGTQRGLSALKRVLKTWGMKAWATYLPAMKMWVDEHGKVSRDLPDHYLPFEISVIEEYLTSHG